MKMTKQHFNVNFIADQIAKMIGKIFSLLVLPTLRTLFS